MKQKILTRHEDKELEAPLKVRVTFNKFLWHTLEVKIVNALIGY